MQSICRVYTLPTRSPYVEILWACGHMTRSIPVAEVIQAMRVQNMLVSICLYFYHKASCSSISYIVHRSQLGTVLYLGGRWVVSDHDNVGIYNCHIRHHWRRRRKKKKYKYILEYIHIYSSYHIYTVGIVDQNAGLIYERQVISQSTCLEYTSKDDAYILYSSSIMRGDYYQSNKRYNPQWQSIIYYIEVPFFIMPNTIEFLDGRPPLE